MRVTLSTYEERRSISGLGHNIYGKVLEHCATELILLIARIKIQNKFTQSLHQEQDSTKGQFDAESSWFEFWVFLLLHWLKNLVFPTIYP